MQLRDIQYVLAVAETGSFSKAAEKMFVSQPALSQLIQRLEDELGVKLFYRENNKVTLTAAGKIFLEDGKTIVELSEQIRKKMADIQDLKRGELSVGISPFYQKCYLTRILPEFQKLYPGIRVQVMEAFTSSLETSLAKGEVDLIIMSDPVLVPNVHSEKLFEESIFLAVPTNHPINKRLKNHHDGGHPTVDLAAFKEEDFVMYKPGRRMRDVSMTLCEEAGFVPKIVFETHSCESINAVVARGMGIGFVPMAAEYTCPVEQRATYYNLESEKSTRTFVIAYRDRYISKAAMEFVRVACHCSDQINMDMMKK